jgi:hypothetical protein
LEEIFNPYREWLDWQQSRGPDYYELLAIDRAEIDVARITLAAEQAMRKVRSFRPGPHAQVWSRLLDEIRAARDCLSNPALKADYDAALARTDRFRSSTGDLASPMTAASLPPLSGSNGPAPVYDRQHQIVSVPTAARRESSDPDSFECTPGPGAIDDLLPPGADQPLPAQVGRAAPAATTLVDDGMVDDSMKVISAPTATAFSTARSRQARRGLALVVIAAAAMFILAAGVLALWSPARQQHMNPTTTADAAPDSPSARVARTDPSAESAQAPLESTQPVNDLQTASVSSTAAASGSSFLPSSETTDAPPTTSTAEPTISTEQKRAKLQSLVAALETAKAALAEQDFALADEQLKRAASLADLPQHRSAVARLAEIANYARQFRDALAAAVGKMQAAETFKVPSGTEVAFVEGFSDKVTLHVLGANTTYAFRDLPPVLALAIADRKLSQRHPTTPLVKGAYLALHKQQALPKQQDSRVQEKARSFWEEAEAGGLRTAHLMPFFSDNYADFLKDTSD